MLISVPVLAGCLAGPAASQATPLATPSEAASPSDAGTPAPTLPLETTPTADICAASGDSPIVELQDLAAINPDERLECFGARTLTVRGWVLFAERGGTCLPSMEPEWLACALSEEETFTIEPTHIPPLQGEGEPVFKVVVHPEAEGLEKPWPANTHLEITGSFDHPAARACTAPGLTAEEQAQLILDCRSEFVVTRAEVVPAS